jgi:hypothetical protein
MGGAPKQFARIRRRSLFIASCNDGWRPERQAETRRESGALLLWYVVNRRGAARRSLEFVFLQSTRATRAEPVRVGIYGDTLYGFFAAVLSVSFASYHGLLPRIPWH